MDMKKFMNRLFCMLAVASMGLFAAGCSEEGKEAWDDALRGDGDYECTITIDGEAIEVENVTAEEDLGSINIQVNMPLLSRTSFGILIPEQDELCEIYLREGVNLCEPMVEDGEEYNWFISGWVDSAPSYDGDLWYFYSAKGSLVVTSYEKGEYIEVEFKDCVVSDKMPYGGGSATETAVINGKVGVKITQGED